VSEDGIEIELYRHRFAAIAEEMGEVLTLAAFSPNIKERRDHSCAVFDHTGDMIAQAAHIPVHLGAAPRCVKAVIERLSLRDGETAIVNDPFAGGTHLPDITLVSAVDVGTGRMYVATRAHHADVGGISPGSLPLARTIDEEGWRCPPVLLDDEVVASLLAVSRTPAERLGDLRAQRAANDVGAARVRSLAGRFGAARVLALAQAQKSWAARRCEALLAGLPDGEWFAEDVLDDARGDGVPVPVRVRLRVMGSRARFDFSESADQVEGPMNAVAAIVDSAVLYVLACVLGDVPANSGLLLPVEVVTRPGSVVDALPPAAVSAGNVETSQRIVDVVMAALRGPLPARIPAASYGGMNNVLIGSVEGAARPFVYYETIGGGLGAGPVRDGASGTQAHMTNTLNTPVEALEHAFPMRVRRAHLREGSGGAGEHRGGEGIVRELEMLEPVELTVITERRSTAPPGAGGGSPGAPGRQWVVLPDGRREELPGKATRRLPEGARFVIETPGGGGWAS
jgi:N-methylhydantoinase B